MQKLNRTSLFVVINSVFIGAQGMIHAVSAIMKGNVPTGGMMLDSIGALTLIQNYLYTGIVSALIGALIVFWALTNVNNRFYTPVFILLCLALFLTGGGVAFILFFLFTIFASTQITGPYKWLGKMLSGRFGGMLRNSWKFFMTASYAFLACGMAVWIFLIPPGMEHAISWKEYLCWSFLLLGITGMIPAILAGLENKS